MQEYVRLIRRGKMNRLTRINRRLFVDLEETLRYASALVEITQDRPVPERLIELLAAIRRAFIQLPFDRTEVVVNALARPGVDPNLRVVICGAARDQLEETHVTFSKLLDVADIQLRVFGSDLGSDQGCSALLVIFTLISASAIGATYSWTNLIRLMHMRKDPRLLLRFLEGFWYGEFQYTVVPFSAWGPKQPVCSLTNGVATYAFPAPNEMVGWLAMKLRQYVESSVQRTQGINRLANTVRDRRDEFSYTYEQMWLDMVTRPRWALRDGGLDRAKIDIQELRDCGYRYVQLTPLSPFPHFRARFWFELRSGGHKELQLNLEPSSLLLINQRAREDSILIWVDRLLAFLAVRVMWTIVMSIPSREERSHGVQRVSKSAVVRPYFRPLPAGHQASSEARMRALAVFRTEPLSGFTFVRQHQRGAEPLSGEPLFSVTELIA